MIQVLLSFGPLETWEKDGAKTFCNGSQWPFEILPSDSAEDVKQKIERLSARQVVQKLEFISEQARVELSSDPSAKEISEALFWLLRQKQNTA